MEWFNEITTFLVIYHVICFTDFVQQQTAQYLMGWSLIFTIAGNIAVNVSIIAKQVLKEICASIKQRMAVKEAKAAKTPKTLKNRKMVIPNKRDMPVDLN